MKKAIAWSVGIVLLVVGGLMFMTQRSADVLVREPGNRMYDEPAPVASKATEEWPFAVMSENVYVDTWVTRASRRRAQAPATFQAACRDTRHERPLPLTGWQRWDDFPSASLITEANKCDLYFEVWEASSTTPPMVVVVFRGTDSWKDWITNLRGFVILRWLFRFIPGIEDQYHFVSRRVGEEFSGRIVSDQAKYRAATIVSTGHSLGGGLAQHFAYSLPIDNRVPRVSHVFAFDPSPVTGWSSVKGAVREENAKGLKTDRIFEHGEILAYIRLLLSYVNPPPAMNPSVTEIRYNFVPSINPLKSHSMRQLACDLVGAEGIAP